MAVNGQLECVTHKEAYSTPTFSRSFLESHTHARFQLLTCSRPFRNICKLNLWSRCPVPIPSGAQVPIWKPTLLGPRIRPRRQSSLVSWWEFGARFKPTVTWFGQLGKFILWFINSHAERAWQAQSCSSANDTNGNDAFGPVLFPSAWAQGANSLNQLWFMSMCQIHKPIWNTDAILSGWTCITVGSRGQKRLCLCSTEVEDKWRPPTKQGQNHLLRHLIPHLSVLPQDINFVQGRRFVWEISCKIYCLFDTFHTFHKCVIGVTDRHGQQPVRGFWKWSWCTFRDEVFSTTLPVCMFFSCSQWPVPPHHPTKEGRLFYTCMKNCLRGNLKFLQQYLHVYVLAKFRRF